MITQDELNQRFARRISTKLMHRAELYRLMHSTITNDYIRTACAYALGLLP